LEERSRGMSTWTKSKTVFIILYTMTIKPIWSNVLVTPIKKPTETDSWLIISTQEEQRVSKGKVIGIGKDVECIEVWDTVHFPVYAPDEVEIWEDKYLVINQKSILCVEK